MAAFTTPKFITDLESYLGAPSGQGSSATGPKFDCSGLVYRALLDLGVQNPPRDTQSQWAFVKKINKRQLAPGDLVFSNWPGDTENPGHVQVYIGGGTVIQSPGSTTGSVDEVSLLSDVGHIVGYGRLPMATKDPTTGQPLAPSYGTSKNFEWTEGWWVAVACGAGLAFANTRFGPIVFGILALALLYQTSLLLQGK